MFVVSLPGVVDTAAVDSLKDCLIAQLQSKASCRLDGGSVERIGTAGLQLLWSAKQSFGDGGLEFDLSPRSPALCQALAVAGLDGPSHFNITPEAQ